MPNTKALSETGWFSAIHLGRVTAADSEPCIFTLRVARYKQTEPRVLLVLQRPSSLLETQSRDKNKVVLRFLDVPEKVAVPSLNEVLVSMCFR